MGQLFYLFLCVLFFTFTTFPIQPRLDSGLHAVFSINPTIIIVLNEENLPSMESTKPEKGENSNDMCLYMLDF